MILTLIKKTKELPENCQSFYFKAEPPLVWSAGQYLRYKLNDETPDERGENRYFTISSAPFEKDIRLTTRFDLEKGSSFKKVLFTLKEGDKIEASGPFGDFTITKPNQHYVFIAGGIGITPFRSIIKQLEHEGLPINITLLYANRDLNIVFKDELEQISKKHPEFKIYYFIDPKRIDDTSIKENIPNLNKPIFYVSGPQLMVEGVESLLEKLGVSSDKIRHDYFPGYSKI